VGLCESTEGCQEACLNDKYLDAKRVARTLPDRGGYSLYQAQMNDMILRALMEEVSLRELPKRIWEPFSALSSERLRDIAADEKFEMVSYGLVEGAHHEIEDSSKHRPFGLFGGVIFHPPYYGSASQSESEADLSNVPGIDEYEDALVRVLKNASDALVGGGMLAAVGRDYRADSKRVRLDLMYLELIEEMPLVLDCVWKSSPDVVLVMRKEL